MERKKELFAEKIEKNHNLAKLLTVFPQYSEGLVQFCEFSPRYLVRSLSKKIQELLWGFREGKYPDADQIGLLNSFVNKMVDVIVYSSNYDSLCNDELIRTVDDTFFALNEALERIPSKSTLLIDEKYIPLIRVFVVGIIIRCVSNQQMHNLLKETISPYLKEAYDVSNLAEIHIYVIGELDTFLKIKTRLFRAYKQKILKAFGLAKKQIETKKSEPYRPPQISSAKQYIPPVYKYNPNPFGQNSSGNTKQINKLPILEQTKYIDISELILSDYSSFFFSSKSNDWSYKKHKIEIEEMIEIENYPTN